MTDGVEMIRAERERQIREEGWTAGHDDRHTDCQLALAAAVYASPIRLYKMERAHGEVSFTDPWPWARHWDKRRVYGDRESTPHGEAADPNTMTMAERIDLLVKAGALVAAEIDRLLRAENAKRGEGA